MRAVHGAIENKAIHAVEEVAREFEHLLGGGGKLGGTGCGLLHQFAHLIHGANYCLRAGGLLFDGGIDFLSDFGEPAGGLGDLRRADGLFVGGCANFLREFVNFGDDVFDFVQRRAEIVAQAQAFFHDARAALHVFDGLARFTLNALNEVGDFLGGLRRFFRQFANFVGYHGEAQAVFAGARRFDGRVQRQQVGLFGEIVDDFDDFADVVGAMAENVDDFRGRLNGVIGAIEAVGGLFHGLRCR